MFPLDLDRHPREVFLQANGIFSQDTQSEGEERPEADDTQEGDDQDIDACPPPVFFDELEEILIAQGTFEDILATLRARTPEAAILLLGPKNGVAITHILPDEAGIGTPASFTLDARGLTKKLKPYVALGLDCHGVAHSHPSGITRLSYGDLCYAQKIFLNPKNTALGRFIMPLVTDGRLYPYVVSREGGRLTVRPARVVLF